MKIPVGMKRVASSCILRNGNALLLLKRNKDPYKGYYLPLGGKVEPYENPIDTAVRETFEESGLTISRPTYCGVLVETSPTKYNWITFIYIVDIDRVPPPLSDEGTLKWIDWDELGHYPIPKTDEFVYEWVRKSKPFSFNADFDADLNLLTMKEEMEGVTVHKGARDLL